MTKLAFSSLLFFTLYSVSKFNVIPVIAFPVNDNVIQDYRGDNPIEGARCIGHHEGIIRQMDNRMDRGRKTRSLYDVTSGNPLEGGQSRSWWEDSNRANGNPDNATIEFIKNRMLEVISDIDLDGADEIFHLGYWELDADTKSDLLKTDETTWKAACMALNFAAIEVEKKRCEG